MPKPTISATTQVTQTTEVKLTTTARQMLKARLEEHAQLARDIKERKARQERLQKEVADLFVKEGQDAALADGTVIDGFRVKRVGGTTRTLMKDVLMRTFEITAEELDAFYDEKPKKAYIRVTAPGERDDRE